MRLNPSDCENGLVLLGLSGGKEKARRKPGGAQWVGVRATGGVVSTGRWAYCVWNDSGGNLRIGWSCAEASIKLGTDAYSWGYGGTATKSHKNKFDKFGQTYGQGDAITCLIDLDRRAISYMKNGRAIPGDCFVLDKEMAGWPLFPHIYTKEAAFSVSFDGDGGAPPLQGGYRWIAEAGECWVASPKQPADGADVAPAMADEDAAGGGGGFVLTPYGWRTAEEAKVPSQEWRGALDAYVRHFTLLLESEYEAERDQVSDRVQKRSITQLQADGVGVGGLAAEFDPNTGRVMLVPGGGGQLPYLSEISRGRAVLLSTEEGGFNVEDAKCTISAEVEDIQRGMLVLSTQYERLPEARPNRWGQPAYRVDLGPNVVAYKRIDRMLDELQRCLGVAQASKPRDNIQKLNSNEKLTGLLLPGTALANALYADIDESAASASKWDPMQRPRPNPAADISRAAREKDIGAAPHRSKAAAAKAKPLNMSQGEASRKVLEERRRLSLIQGPPGTGKTTTAVAIICGWLRSNRGPILATSFSNRGTDNMAESLHNLGVRVLRVGLCGPDVPYSLDAWLKSLGVKRGDKGLRTVLQQVDVVAATCIGCGMGPLDKHVFPYVVVDEAAQVIEPAVILPLGKGAVQAVMVGDQCQLPATVLSQQAQKGGLDISMFDRLLSMGMEYQMLTEQYRMHPVIAAFPSWRFYRGELRSATRESDRQLPPALSGQAPLVLLHVEANEQSAGSSKKNPKEAACVAAVVGKILRAMPSRLTGNEVGVITPYAAQVAEIRRAIPAQARDFVQISSVDAFQGCEKEFILLSLVRANARGDVGFVADWRRLNVALTRAKRQCVIVGNLPTWFKSESALIRDWIGYHGPGDVEFHAFAAGRNQALPHDVGARMGELQMEFASKPAEAAALPRVSTLAKGATGVVKAKLWEIEANLVKCLASRDEQVVQKALDRAVEIGIQNSTMEEAEHLLRRLVAERMLSEAVQCGDTSVIETALAQATEAGVEQSVLDTACDATNSNAAALQLETAMALDESAEGFEATLGSAVLVARERGVVAELVIEAEMRLRYVAAARGLQEALGTNREEDLSAAVQEAREAGVPEQLLEMAETTARYLTAGRELREAMQALDAGLLAPALTAASQVGVDPALTAAGEQLLMLLEAASALAAAIDAADPAAIRPAIGTAEQAGLDARTLAAARHALQSALELAIDTAGEEGDQEALHTLLAEAKDCGVEEHVLEWGRSRLRAAEALGKLVTAIELAQALEMTGAVTQQDEAAFRSALQEASDAEVDPPVLAEAEGLLLRIAAMRGDTPSAKPTGPPPKRQRTQAANDGQGMDLPQVLSSCLMELAVVRCRKKQAAEAEDFDIAFELKQCEASATRRLAEVRSDCRLQSASGDPALLALEEQLRDINRRKREASEAEDFDAALELREQAAAVEWQLQNLRPNAGSGASQDGQAQEELMQVRQKKRQATMQEDFALAGELRKREVELEAQIAAANGAGGAVDERSAALGLVNQLEGGSREELLRGCREPRVLAWAAEGGPQLWAAVADELRVMAGQHVRY